MKRLVLVLGLALSGFILGQHYETVHFSSIDEMFEYVKFTDSLKSNFNPADHIDSVFILLNKYRVKQGVNPVEFDKNLCKVADIQAEYNATNDTVTHNNVDSLNTIHKRGMQFGEYYVAAEVATVSGFTDAGLINKTISMLPMYNLQYSPAHAFIMKQPEYTRCGISLVQSKTDTNKFYTIIVFAIK